MANGAGKAAVILLGFLAGCTSAPVRPECQYEGPARPMHCPVYRQPRPEDCAPVYVDGEYRACVNRSEILRGYPWLLRWFE